MQHCVYHEEVLMHRYIEAVHKSFVTVHAKTSLVRTKIEINFLSPAYSYTH